MLKNFKNEPFEFCARVGGYKLATSLGIAGLHITEASNEIHGVHHDGMSYLPYIEYSINLSRKIEI